MNQDVKKIIKISSLSVFFLFIILYAFFVSKDLIFGVKIKNVLINKQKAETTTKVSSNVVEISGNAENAINLKIDGREISVDKKGNFDETIVLLPGYNIIDVRAQDKFGHVDEKNYKITL